MEPKIFVCSLQELLASLTFKFEGYVELIPSLARQIQVLDSTESFTHVEPPHPSATEQFKWRVYLIQEWQISIERYRKQRSWSRFTNAKWELDKSNINKLAAHLASLIPGLDAESLFITATRIYRRNNLGTIQQLYGIELESATTIKREN